MEYRPTAGKLSKSTPLCSAAEPVNQLLSKRAPYLFMSRRRLRAQSGANMCLLTSAIYKLLADVDGILGTVLLARNLDWTLKFVVVGMRTSFVSPYPCINLLIIIITN